MLNIKPILVIINSGTYLRPKLQDNYQNLYERVTLTHFMNPKSLVFKNSLKS